jgi:hypothetical protein
MADTAKASRTLAPATITMQFPAALGGMERPAVELNHAAHTDALADEGCKRCHTIDDKGLTPGLTSTAGLSDRDSLIDAFHGTCVGCHQERSRQQLSSGPVTCGECHARRPPAVSTRAAMSFDYSLHGRHAQAFPEKCETCHHIWDEARQKLRYDKDKEEACRACHGAVDEEKKLSLANASHRSCIGCHLERSGKQLDSGPVLCVRCHDHEMQATIKALEEIPRLLRGQPDSSWIYAAEARSKLVPFNHKDHEPLTRSCSTCHHQTLKPCKECHSLQGREEGSGVTVAQAYHLSSSEHSCIGCHQQQTEQKECAGCHLQMPQPAGERSCLVCHNGPEPGAEPSELPVVPVTTVELAALPSPTVDVYPESVTIGVLTEKYEPSTLPHAKIVARLDTPVRASKLAVRFHATTEKLCSGCHHHSPVGTRPPPCRSCHGEESAATIDKPSLKTAYHRQCMGCHQLMKIDKLGCTDCHAAKEVLP